MAFTPLEMRLSARARGFESHPVRQKNIGTATIIRNTQKRMSFKLKSIRFLFVRLHVMMKINKCGFAAIILLAIFDLSCMTLCDCSLL